MGTGIGIRKQVQLVQMVSVKQAGGNWVTVEGARTGVWAEVTNPSGFRDYAHGQTQLGETKRFKIRYRFDKFPDADWLIRYDNKDWTITEKRKINEKRFYWQITATVKSSGV